MLIADIYRFKDSLYDYMRTTSKEKQAEDAKKETAWRQKYAKNGKWKANYSFANGRGGIAIWDFESGEEMYRILSEAVAWPYLDSEIIPLQSESISSALKEPAKAERKAAKK